MLALLSVLVFTCVAVTAWAVLPDASRRAMQRRLYSEVSEVKRPPLWQRVAVALEPWNRRLPTGAYAANVTRLLEAAGFRLSPLHFLAIQEFGVLTGLLAHAGLAGVKHMSPVGLAFFGMLGFFVPILWLHNQIKQRRLTVGRDLPEIVDLLALCVGAGSDFMGALGRIVREFRPCPVREELGILLQEVRMGKRRRDALRAFATRLQTPATSTFARTLIQVDRMGTGMGEALTILSEDMRLARYHWAERFAQQAPMKMLIPLMISLGSAMIIVAGPILMQFIKGGLMSGPQMSAESAKGF